MLDVGTSGGVWGLERGYCMMVGGADAAVASLAPVFDILSPPLGVGGTHARALGRPRAGRAGLAALRTQRRGPLREDGPQRHRVRTDGRLRGGPEPAGAHRALRVRHRPARGHRAVATRQRGRLVAVGPDRSGARRRPRAVGLQRRRERQRRGPVVARGGDRPGRARHPCSPPRCSRGSAHAARRPWPTRCSPRCAASSAATSSRRRRDRPRAGPQHVARGGRCRGGRHHRSRAVGTSGCRRRRVARGQRRLLARTDVRPARGVGPRLEPHRRVPGGRARRSRR